MKEKAKQYLHDPQWKQVNRTHNLMEWNFQQQIDIWKGIQQMHERRTYDGCSFQLPSTTD